ncbi:MAG: DUF1275 family protein [Acetobacteraceae bacterium]|nr:DUF1275 family protein [Acetobacteraceae bacterium]
MADAWHKAASGRRTMLADFLTAGGMAFLAGATDVCGLSRLRDLFVSFMSGNTTMLGLALGSGDWPRGALILEIVGLFVAGAAAGAALESLGNRPHAAVVTCVVTLVLAVPLIQPRWTVAALVLAMGALNAAMSRVGEVTVSLTYVTGTLVKFGQGLGRTLCGTPGGWVWLWQLPMWLSLLAGATAAAVVERRFGGEAYWWPLPALALGLALWTLLRGPG